MLTKLLVPLVFLAAQLMISWYGLLAGKLSSQGSFLGISYDSTYISILVLQLKFIWLFIIINFLFSIGFQWGFAGYKHYIVIASIWVASGPIAAVILNAILIKEPLNWVMISGLVLITVGSVLVTAHKEILSALS